MKGKSVILLLETEPVARHALAEYLRECGYRVVEATTTDEAATYFEGGDSPVETVLLDVRAAGSNDVFSLAQWIRSRHAANVVMVGALETAAKKAGELCAGGSSLSRPYTHTTVLDLIKRLRAQRDRTP